MSNVITYQRFWMRRDNASNWSSVNPTLAAGEWGVEISDADPAITKFKLGDGITAWNDLEYKGAGIHEAPSDGKQYARKNGGWSEVQSGVGEYQRMTADGNFRITANGNLRVSR